MRVRVRSGGLEKTTAEVVVAPLASGEEQGAALRALARGAGGTALRRAIAAARFSGREGQVVTMPLGGGGRRTLCLVGLGDGGRLDLDAWRRAAGRGCTAAQGLGARRVAIVVDARASDRAHVAALAEGFRLASYRFAKYKSADVAPPEVTELQIVAPGAPAERTLAPEWRLLDAALDGVTTARDLVNEPAAVKTPTYLAALAKRIGAQTKVEVEIWDPRRLRREGMAGLLAVARGSDEEPRLIRMHYRGPGARRHVALVGKGVTFDSGGLSLKPAKAMETMKIDMAGGAAVLAVMAAIGRLRPAIEVTGLVPATENLPGRMAQKPGDVIRYRNGKTVEVLNTDAEGRLILADALTLAAAAKPKPAAIIDLATLTGACIIALGQHVAGIFGNDQALVERLIAVGRETGEPLWQLPLVADYREDIASPVADLKNIGGGGAGSITAALFLENFVDGVPWAHLDIAGPAFAERPWPYAQKGGTGFGVRTILRYLLGLAAESVEGAAEDGGARRAGSSARRRATPPARAKAKARRRSVARRRR